MNQLDPIDCRHDELICLLAEMAGLLHDLGKAIQAFQDRLKNKLKGHNLIRHEWVSLRLLEAFVGQDTDAQWLARLANTTEADIDQWLKPLYQDQPGKTNRSPFRQLAHAPLASALGWLVVTHHRLPVLPGESYFQVSLVEVGLGLVTADLNEENFRKATPDSLKCQVPCDHIPRRSWALFRARDVMRGVIESFQTEHRT